jgi:putative hemolysin
MSQVLINFGVVLLFIIVGGFFAASEMALVSLREGQIAKLALEKPKRGRRLARLTSDPNRYLAAVQVGVTLAGFLSAGFGAARIAPEISPYLEELGLSPGLSSTIAFVGVTIVIVYFSLVFGELAPKRLALQRSESVALVVAGTVNFVASIARPFIWLLSASTDLVVKVMGGDPSVGRERITEEELRGLVATHTELTEQERELIDDVFAAGDRELREIMVPRIEVAFMKESMSIGAAAREASNSPHSRYPLVRRDPDDVRGFVHVRDLLDPKLRGTSGTIGALRRPLAQFPGTKRVIPALAEMRDAGFHLAIVVDEYGGTDGIVTMEDLVEELVGDIRDEYDHVIEDRPPGLSAEREIAGRINLDDFCEDTGLVLPDGPYETLAGFVIDRLGHLPSPGDRVEAESCVFTVLAVDGRRIDRILVEPAEQAAQPDVESP